MSAALTLATARRVLLQLRHDPRTVVLLLFVPPALITLLRYVFDSARLFDSLAPAMLGIFPFILMFLVTSITTLRERTGGTLERLMTTPLGKADLLAGYALAFGALALAQVLITVVVSWLLGLDIAGSAVWLVVVAALDALLGVALGLFTSAFARSEFQAIQFLPLVVFPQLLLCGLFQPRAQMATVLRWASDVMPLSYAVEALQHVADHASVDGGFVRDVLVIAGCLALALALATATLRRRTD